MKVLHCLHVSNAMRDGSSSPGGVAGHVDALSSQLQGLGWEVIVLEIAKYRQHASDRAQLRLPESYGPWRGARVLPRLKELLRRTAPDVVHLHSPFTVLSPLLVRALRTQVPTVATLHDVRPFCFLASRRFGPTGALCDRKCGAGCVLSGCYTAGSVSDLARIPRRLVVESWSLREWRRLPRIIAVSRYIESLAVQHGFDASRMEVVPGFSRAAIESPSARQHTIPRILFVGRLAAEKGVFVLLDALSMLRDCSWRAEFVGSGHDGDALRKRVVDSGLQDRIEFTGHLDEAQRDERLRSATLVVFPSLVAEGLGIVVMEAFRFGKPVVTFALGGTGDLVKDGVTGLIAQEGNRDDLAGRIRALLAQPAWATELGGRGRELVRREYSPDLLTARVLRNYELAMQHR